MAIIFALAALCLCGSALASGSSLGGCPTVATAPNFDPSRYLGRWFENRKFHADFEGRSKCVIADYSNAGQNLIHVVNSYVSGETGKPASIESTLRIPDPNDASKMKIRYESMPPGVEGDYLVLGSDYTSYAVVYSCSSRGVVTRKFAWILTRERTPPQSVVDEAVAVLTRVGIDASKLHETEQVNC